MEQKKQTHRMLLLLIIILIITIASIGGTFAYLTATSETVENRFTPATVNCEILQDAATGTTIKENVRVHNIGDVDAYVRAVIVITWKDENGNVLAEVPVENEDYQLQLNTDDWILDGECYYYSQSIAKGEETKRLIQHCNWLGETPKEGYRLSVEVVTESIQATEQAVTDAWTGSPLANTTMQGGD